MLTASARLLYSLNNRLGEQWRSTFRRYLNPERKRFVVPELSLADFTARLSEREVDYVLLNPEVEQAEPLELLIADEHLDRLNGYVTDWPVGTPVRIYSISARTGTAYYPRRVKRTPYNRMAAFPPYLGQQLLERAVATSGGAKVLDPRDAFLVTAYRAAYMEPGCWRWEGSDPSVEPIVDYESQLRKLAPAAGVELPEPLTPMSLDRLLNEHGWRPPPDLLEKATGWAPWIKEAFPDLVAHDEESSRPGLVVYFIRERAVRDGWKPQILATLIEKGFELMHVEDLDERGQMLAERWFRGGNWGPITQPVSGGRPACIVVALDVLPLPVREKYRRQYPATDNQKNITAKRVVRELIHDTLAPDQLYNPMHGTDNSRQAWLVVRLLLAEHEQKIRQLVADRRQAFATDDVLEDLTAHGCRSKVELIEYKGQRAVRKTFRPHASRYMEREIEVMEELAPVCHEIVKLLERGPNYIITEYVEADVSRPKWPRPLPFWAMRQLADFMRRCVAQGWDPIDLRPNGSLILTSSGIRVIDYEFWRRCDPSTPLHLCKSIAGLPRDDTGDRPRGVPFIYNPYPVEWFAWTALDVRSFLYAPAWQQRAKRTATLSRRYARWSARAVAKRLVPRKLRWTARRLLGSR
jgi:hypothetical protein